MPERPACISSPGENPDMTAKASAFLTPAGRDTAKAWYSSWIGSDDGQSQEELQSRGEALDARLAELNANRRATYGEDWFNRAENNRLGGFVNVEEQVDQAAQEGLAEGYQNVTGGISSAINAPFRFIWDSVPKWLWLVALFAAFLYLGGGAVLRRKVSGL